MTTTLPEEAPPAQVEAHDLKPIALKHPSWWAGSAILLAALASFVQILATNANMQWPVVGAYLFHPEILAGLQRTLVLTALAMIIGLAFGVVLAIMRLSKNPLFQAFSWAWIWFFRGVPPLVQLIFWYNLALLFPDDRHRYSVRAATRRLGYQPADHALQRRHHGLSLTESAYAAEMIRAGIQAVNGGQTEAARLARHDPRPTLRRIILPQALRIIIPPIGNDTISMLKFTSLVSVLALPDLLYSAQMIYSRTYQTIPLLLVATIWYLVLSTILTVIEHRIEKDLASDHLPGPARLQMTWLFRFKRLMWRSGRAERVA